MASTTVATRGKGMLHMWYYPRKDCQESVQLVCTHTTAAPVYFDVEGGAYFLPSQLNILIVISAQVVQPEKLLSKSM